MELLDFPITLLLIALTVLFSVLVMNNPSLKYKFVFYPSRMKGGKENYRLITHAFLHGDYLHLFFNMFVLFHFGRIIEILLVQKNGALAGSIQYILLYFLGIIAAAIWPFVRHQNNPAYMSLGASGAVASVLFAVILWLPDAPLYLLFIPFEIKAWVFGLLYLGFEYYQSTRQGQTGIAHDAHFGGAIFGILYILWIDIDIGKAFIYYIFK
ncbi:MAG: rhomboid family intramembrane serine protease [Crocinitomicaceae bacterium]|nr:rhomboid family intramembrane serine protease [Crocinitomicaceae bacterium]